VGFLERRQFAFEFKRDLEIKVPVVPFIGLHRELSDDLLAIFDGEVLVEVEDCLLPVSVASLWGGGEACPLVAFGELNVEERD